MSGILTPQARSRWLFPQARHLTPARIEAILLSALTAESPHAEQALYTLMERTWPRLSKNVQELKSSVRRLEWQVLEDGDCADPDLCDLLRAAKDGFRADPTRSGLGWGGTLEALLDGWFRGVSVVELEWGVGRSQGSEVGGQGLLPRQAFRVDPSLYGWDAEEGRLTLFPMDREKRGPFPPHKFLIGVRNTSAGHDSGGALLRPLAWWWLAANFSQEWLLNFAQIYGQPFRFATYDPARPETRGELATLLEDMGSSAWMAAPEGVSVELKESAKTGRDNPQAYVLELADKACDLLVLGQTLTSDVGDSGSRALGDVHNSVRSDVIDGAAEWLAEVLNDQLVPSLAELNREAPPARLPWFEPARKEVKDSLVLAQTVEILARAGLPLSTAYLYELMDIPAPEAGAELLPKPQAPAGGQMSEFGGRARQELMRVVAKLPPSARDLVLAKLRENRE